MYDAFVISDLSENVFLKQFIFVLSKQIFSISSWIPYDNFQPKFNLYINSPILYYLRLTYQSLKSIDEQTIVIVFITMTVAMDT